jgi:hypothetical protein
LDLGRLHETFRFISVTRFKTVGRTPWTGDQLVARPLLTAPGDCDDGEVGGMKRHLCDVCLIRPLLWQSEEEGVYNSTAKKTRRTC